jgi:RNA polymerase sigma factor (sigma-70 family)
MLGFFRRRHPAEAEFRALIERYAGLMRATLRQIDRKLSEADLQELEQDVRLKLWQALSVEGNFDKPASYVRRIVINVSIDAARKKIVRGNDAEHLDYAELDLADYDHANAMELRSELSALIKTLTQQAPESADALGLYLKGFTTEEIGALMGWSEAKARNLLYRYLDEIRSKFGRNFSEEG